MGACCDLEVDVNGEETFMVDKNILSSFSRKFSHLFGNLMGTNGGLKVIFNDFPGGARGFEVIVRFCYNSSRMVITPSNIILLYCAARFMDMESDGPAGTISQIESFLKGIHFWTWSELLDALKQCQEYSISAKSYSVILDRIVGHLIERLALPSVTSPYTCSSNRSSLQFSGDTCSTNSWKNNCSGATWWFEHLLFLNFDLIDKVIRTMLSYGFDHAIISKFLFYYHKLSCTGAAQADKSETTEVVINLLSLLDKGSLSSKDLFNLYRIATSLKISTCCKNKIENLIGPQLDQAAIDYLLLPSPHGRDHAYDVDFVLRLIQIFVHEGDFGITLIRLKRAAEVMDSFLVEVAPDPHLKPFEFAALITVLPDAARECHDRLYLAMDMYLKVHAGLSEKEKMSICCALNYEKLSAELVRHLTRNLVFPLETKPRAHAYRQSRMKSLLQENDHLKNFLDSMFRKSFKNTEVKEEDVENRIAATEELRLSTEDQKSKGEWQVMQSGAQLASVMKSGFHIMSNARYLTKLCS